MSGALCGWREGGRLTCSECAVVEVPEGPRWLCRPHAALLRNRRADAERRRRSWLALDKGAEDRAARLRSLG